MLFSSCNDNEQLFSMTYEFDIVLVAGLSQFEVHFIDSYGIPSRRDEFLAANGRTISDIASIVPKSAELVNRQSGVPLDFIRDITLLIFDGDQFNPNQTDNLTEIFFRESVPQDQRSFINLLPSVPDVKDRLLEDNFNVRFRWQPRFPPPNTVEARLKLVFAAQ